MSDVKNPTHSCICDLAARQGGFVSYAQLGSRSLAESWVRSGRLVRAWHGVYVVGHLPRDPRARAHGAVLAAGEGAALAGVSAAAFYGAVRHWPDTPELISPRRCRVRGLTLHHCRSLLGRHVHQYDGLRVTSPARTALDLAARVTLDRLKGIVDHLRLRHGLTLAQLADVILRQPRHPGARPLRRVLGDSGRRPSRSELERRWRRLGRGGNLPPFEMNVVVAGYEVDVLVDGCVVVEIDTVATHLLNFESDRRRDADILARTGIPTVRITDVALGEDPAAVLAQVNAVVRRVRAGR